jgi:hypothetical protein
VLRIGSVMNFRFFMKGGKFVEQLNEYVSEEGLHCMEVIM